ncbi:hypothetical protein WICPIJ_007075 [Wickerhamomyces pijperi]|uniref:Uncharacterized protein n=1 Tax=Wickerhamomyces pijperi TaxID=599730 RepID=A0A9P8Q0V1_WICPI|nr:hypothetical protein WICPIJ_007075 [Wickerhamomyces pijperi]
MIMRILLGWFWINSDHGINSQNSNASLQGRLQGLDLGHGWFQDTGDCLIDDLPVDQIQTIVFIVLLLEFGRLSRLRSGVISSQLGNQFRGVLGGVGG